MRQQILEIQDNDKYKLTNILNDDHIEEANYIEAKDLNKGWSKERTLRKVASIPIDVLNNDFDGYIFLNSPFNSPEGRVALKRFLGKFPKYKSSLGGI